MRVTEQIDAIECLGTHPLAYLVVPRFFAIILSSLFLLIIGLVISVAGSVGVIAVDFFVTHLIMARFGSLV